MQTTTNIQTLITYSEGGITSKVVLKSDSLNVTLFCMAKNTDISQHTSTKEALVEVIEGKGVFILNETPLEMKQGTLIHLQPDTPHSISVTEDTSFLLILVK